MKKYASILLTLALLCCLLCNFTISTSARADRGDANTDGNIDMKDVLLLRKYMAHVDVTIDLEAADANGDSSPDMKDVLLIRQYLAHLDVHFAPYEDDEGDYIVPTGFVTSNLRPNQIVLSYYNLDASDMAVTWHTTVASNAPEVQYVKVADGQEPDFSKASVAKATTEVFANTETMGYDYDTFQFHFEAYTKVNDYTHRAIMTDLDFDSSYAYRVGDSKRNCWSTVATFKTRPESTEKFSFAYMSDSQVQMTTLQDAHKFMNNAIKGALQKDPNFDFILHGGDVVEQGKFMQQWEVMLDGNAEYLRKYPFMIATGNHESTNDTGGEYTTYRHITVDLPEPNGKKELGIYYSFDYGNVHFVVINTNCNINNRGTINKEEKEWVAKDLAENAKNPKTKWVIAVMHAPMISSKKLANNYLMDVFDEYNVDLALQADEHVYSISYPVNNDQVAIKDTEKRTIDGVDYYVNPNGTIYQTFATCGYSTQKCATPNYTFLTAAGDGKQSSWGNIFIDENKLKVETYYYNDGDITAYSKGIWGIIKE